jgi:hypothetical protein
MSIHQTSTFRSTFLAVAGLASVGLLAVTSVGCGGEGAGGGGDNSGNTSTPPSSTTSGSATTSTPSTPSSGATAGATGKHGLHAHCGWIGADTADAGIATFKANPDYFDAIHPKWYTLNSDGSPRSIAFTDDSRVIDTAKAHGVKLIPLIDSDSASYLRTIISSSSNIQRHVSQIVDVVTRHGYDGIELDYEHLWSKGDRAGYTALVQQMAQALHAQGKVLTLALPAMDHDDGNNAYDYAALNAAADVMHLMAYDYHYMGGDHMGPLAPKGWVDGVTKRAATIGDPKKYVMGVANYAISGSWYGPIPDAIAKCGGNYSSQTNHMASCSYGHPEAGLSPNCNNIWFEDAKSIGEKVELAKAAGLGGIGYWTVGSEPQGWFDAIHAAYP